MGATGSMRKGALAAAVALALSGGAALAQDAPPPTCPKAVSQSYRFCSAGPIDLTRTESTTLTPIAQYPIRISAAGAQGQIASLEVQFEGFSHARMDRLRIVLQSPAGRAIALRDGYRPWIWADVAAYDHSAARMDFADMADRGSEYPTYPGSVLLGTRFIPTFATSGRSGVPAPAPQPPFAAFFDDFSGESPNGEWRLWIAHSGNRTIPASGGVGRVCVAVGTHAMAERCPALVETTISGSVSASDPSTLASVISGDFMGNCHPGDPDTGAPPGSVDFGIPPPRDYLLQTALTTITNPFGIPVCAVIDPDYSGCQGSRPRLWVTRNFAEFNSFDEYAFAKIESDRTTRAAWGVRIPPGQSANFRVGPGPGGDCPQFRYDIRLVPYGVRTDRVFRSNF